MARWLTCTNFVCVWFLICLLCWLDKWFACCLLWLFMWCDGLDWSTWPTLTRVRDVNDLPPRCQLHHMSQIWHFSLVFFVFSIISWFDLTNRSLGLWRFALCHCPLFVTMNANSMSFSWFCAQNVTNGSWTFVFFFSVACIFSAFLVIWTFLCLPHTWILCNDYASSWSALCAQLKLSQMHVAWTDIAVEVKSEVVCESVRHGGPQSLVFILLTLLMFVVICMIFSFLLVWLTDNGLLTLIHLSLTISLVHFVFVSLKVGYNTKMLCGQVKACTCIEAILDHPSLWS